MNQQALELQERTRKFASAVIAFCEALPRAPAAQHISEQLVASSTSADSNYRATCRSRSPDEFIAKIGVAAEEADESKGRSPPFLLQSNRTAEGRPPANRTRHPAMGRYLGDHDPLPHARGAVVRFARAWLIRLAAR